MNFASSRRFFFILIFVVIIIGVGILFLIPVLNKAPTCTDGKQNAEESGVDCGGNCEYLCKNQVLPFPIDFSRSFLSSDKRISMIAVFSNQNKTSGVKKADYRFVAYDKLGGVIRTKDGTTSIGANSKNAIFEGPFPVGDRVPYTTTFEWVNPLSFSKTDSNVSGLHLDTISTDLKTDENTFLTVVLKNSMTRTVENVPVVVVLYDKDGNGVAASKTILDVLNPDQTAEIYFSWNHKITEEIANIEVLPVFNQFSK
jgi:hypothetical protein